MPYSELRGVDGARWHLLGLVLSSDLKLTALAIAIGLLGRAPITRLQTAMNKLFVPFVVSIEAWPLGAGLSVRWRLQGTVERAVRRGR